MGPYSDWYAPGPGYDDVNARIAYSLIDAPHTGLTFNPNGAWLQQMQYQFVLGGTTGTNSYRIDWDVITWDVTSGDLQVAHHAIYLGGNGGEVLSPIFYQAPPYWDNTMCDCDGYVVTWVDNVYTSAYSGSWVAGSGPFHNAGGGCSSCTGQGGSLAGGTSFGGISAEFSLGQTTNGYPAGILALWASEPSLALATPAALLFTGTSPDVQVVQALGQLRQVRAPQALADIITDNSFTYEIRFYLASQYSSLTNSSGLYYPIGSPTPFVTWTIQNPDASTNTYNRVEITETRGSQVNTYMYTYTAATGSWVLDYPASLREDQVTSVMTTNSDGSYSRTVTTEIRVPGSADQSKVRRVYQTLSYSAEGSAEVLTSETKSPDTNPQTTTFTYDSNYFKASKVGTFVPLRGIFRPNGTWTYYNYLYDDGLTAPNAGPMSGELVRRVYSGFTDDAAPTNTPDTSLCRYIEYDYTPMYGSADDGTQYPASPRTVTEYVDDQVVSLTYYVIQPGEVDTIRCQRPYAYWSDSDNLVSVTKYYTSGSFSNHVQSVLNPDGTMSIYQYGLAADSTLTNMVWSSQPNTAQTAIIDGTEEISVFGSVGQMLSDNTVDIATGITLSLDIYGNFDTLNRPQQVTHLDGTTEYMQYACCGLDNATDRDGVTTFYTYDAMKRLVATSRLNITTTTVLDSAGRTVGTVRTGTDASQITLSQSQYDLSGRLTTETNALNGVTSYSYSSDPNTGALIRTVTNPDGGTRIEAYYVDGSMKEISGTAVHSVEYQYGVDSDGAYRSEIKIASDGSTNEWVKTSTDLLGHSYKTLYPDGAFSQSYFNNQGQLWRGVDPDSVTSLSVFNGKGEVAYSIAALSSTALSISDYPTLLSDLTSLLSGIDRITATVSDATTDHSANVRRARTWTWDTLNANSSNLISMAESSTDGLRSWQTQYRDASTPVTSSAQTVYSTGGYRYATNTAPDSSYAISIYQSGRLSSNIRRDSLNNQLSSQGYSYDPHGRQNAVTDARNGTTSYAFNYADLVTSVTTPSPGSLGMVPQVTTTVYNTMLQATSVIQPDGASVNNSYLLTGELGQTSGARTYAAGYSYDYAGRMKTMTNWSSFPTGARVTTWNYGSQRGWLTSKTYDGGTAGPSYAYTPAGRLYTRTWARGVTTTYAYDNAGGLYTVTYSDSTPGVTYSYDRRGRQSTIVRNGMTTTFAYNFASQPLSESYSGGTLSGLSVTNGYDTVMRRTNLAALNSSTPLLQHTFGFDNASRLQSVSDGTDSATYSYLANSPLVSQIVFKQSSTVRMTTTKQYDFLNRLTSISSTPGGSGQQTVSYSYSYNSANQRVRSALADGSYWLYVYDSLGQVITGHKFWSDQTPVAGQQFDYRFDTIGNRSQALAGGDQNGANQRSASYTANNLNQYTQRTVPGDVDVMGLAFATNPVTVAGQTAYRKGEYFRDQGPVSNSSTAVWTNITISATGQSSVSGNAFVPQTPEAFAYDADGNLTSDGRWHYGWDAENRLVAMTNNNTSVGPQQVLHFEYDAKSRRIHKQVWGNNNGSGSPTNDLKFVYDGWNLLGDLTTANAAVRLYMWGLDLSGSPQGAGGVGGLLQVGYYGSSTTNCFVAFDGNGNVAGLISAADGTSVGQYEYGPFGELLRATGPMARVNPVRFSTKYQDDETQIRT